jgi:glycosyltransferase involved in cell wall biosynthesis
MTSAPLPTFSVVIATYNWGSALRIALTSVLDQTCTDFEVLVVGDCCTDDSGEVVASFGDARLHWHNLSENHGSQWAPNNLGLELARGEYIAYLGHDDLWWPTHLETALATFRRTGADMVAAAALLYGPPESGIRAVTGFFPNDTYTPRHFFPPSSMLHRRELGQRVGGWRPPEEANVAVDVDFLGRCRDAGARIAATGEFTAFKFNAAWRRDAYRQRNPSEQREFLARMREQGDAFRLGELSGALRAASEDRLQRIEVPPDAQYKATRSAAINHDFKGSRRGADAWVPILRKGRRRYLQRGGYAGFEWHALEEHPVFGGFRWSGPSRRSTLVLPEPVDRPTEVTLLLVNSIDRAVRDSARLGVNGVQIDAVMSPGPAHTTLWQGRIDPERLPPDDLAEMRLTLTLERTWRPIDLGINEDRRWLGLAVGWVEVRPAGALVAMTGRARGAIGAPSEKTTHCPGTAVGPGASAKSPRWPWLP